MTTPPPKKPPMPGDVPKVEWTPKQEIALVEGRLLKEIHVLQDLQLDKRLRLLESLNLAKNVAGLAETVTALCNREINRRPQVWDWSAMGKEEAADAWEKILTWRRNVFRVQWPTYFQRTVVSCWPQHPQVREELGNLYQLWDWSYHDPKTTVTNVGNWLALWMPGGVNRIEAELKNCKEAGQHKLPPVLGPETQDDDQLISQMVEADVDARPDLPMPQEEPPVKPHQLTMKQL